MWRRWWATGRSSLQPGQASTGPFDQEPLHIEHVVAQFGAHGTQQGGGHPGVAQGAVVVVPGEPVAVAAVDQSGLARQVEVGLGHPQGVEGDHRTGHQLLTAQPLALGHQEGQVEPVDVVPDDHPSRQEARQVRVHVGEGRSAFQHLGGDAVDVGGPGAALGIDQRAEGVHLATVGVEHDHGHFDHPLGLWGEPGRLQVDHGETRPVEEGELHGGHRRGWV